MAFLWSDRAIQGQRDVNDAVKAGLPGSTEDLLRGVRPLLVRTAEPIQAGGSGVCELLSGRLGSELQLTGTKRVMYNIASDCDLKQNEDCLAFRIGIPDSADGGWVLMRCVKPSDLSNPNVPCLACTTDEGPTIYQADFTTVTAGNDEPSNDDDDLASYLLNATDLFLTFRGEDEFGFCEWSTDPFIVPTTQGNQTGNTAFHFTVQLIWKVGLQDTSYFEMTINRDAGVLFGLQKHLDTAVLNATAADCFNASRALTLNVTEPGVEGQYLANNPVLNLLYNG